METTTRTDLTLAHDTGLISTRGDEARLDEPASLVALEEQSHPAWLSQLQLYDRAFALAKEGISGPALASALTAFNATLCPPVDTLGLSLAIETGELQAQSQAHPATPAPTLDQAIATQDVAALYACLPQLVELHEVSPISYALKKSEIKAAFGKAINMNDLEHAVSEERRKREQEQRGEKLDVADVAKQWAREHRTDWAYDGRAKVWRHWNGQYWEAVEPRSALLDLEAIAALHEAEIDIHSSGLMDCFQRIAAAECTTLFTEGQGKLNFENGTLDLETMTIRPFKREDSLTYCLPYCYAPGKHPTINTFLKDTIPDVHARQAYIAHLGLALMQDTSMHFVLLLLGPTRSGKSTLLALANAVCGTSAADNYAEDFSFAGPSLFSRELEGKRSRSRWVQRRMVCADEIPAEALRDEELFKTMSAHGGVEMRGMHKDEDTANRWKPKMILAANDRPRYKDVAGAVKERCISVSCPNHRVRGERDPQLFGKLRAEIGAFAATCLELARRVVARRYYPMSYAMKHMTDVIARDGNHVKAFVAECCIVGVAEDWLVSESIYGAYLSYCANNGHKSPLPRNVLSSTICNMGIGVAARRGRSEGRVVCGLQGIRLRVEQDPWMTDEEERSRYVDDVLLIDSTELLMVVAGQLRVVQRASNTVEEPVEPVQKTALMVLLAETGNTSIEDTHPVEVIIVDEGQGGSVENNESITAPSTPATRVVEEPLERNEDVNGPVDGFSRSPQQPATPPYRCSVYGCGEVALVHSEDAEEEERTYGLWCAVHQERSETMRLGMLL